MYEYTRETYPSLYKRIEQKVKQNKWIPTGCTWVEMDCNISGGEALVRQILLGMRFFQKEFNHTPVCLWIPDVFGYNASMPQLLKLSGINNFMTGKMSWSQFTKFPHHTFHWEGIDGSRVLAHFMPNESYGSQHRANQVIPSTRNYRQKDRSTIQAALYGYSDGGGGPSKEQIERMRRFKDLEGVPRLTPMAPATFFEELKARSRDLPIWVGELYLEMHRGTYTTQGWTKRNNRKSELLLRETELLSTLAMVEGGRYQQQRLNDAWKLVLLNQFHDILPGSSIDKVYEDADRDYAEVYRAANAVGDAARKGLALKIDTRGEGNPVVVRNTLSWAHEACVSISASEITPSGTMVATDSNGNTVPVQKDAEGNLYFKARAPSMGHAVYHLTQGSGEEPAFKTSERRIENEFLRVTFNRDGHIVSFYDKESSRETIEKGKVANELHLFEDKSVGGGPAWDIDIYYQDKMLERGGALLSSQVIEHGPVRTVMRQKRRISNSTMTQDIILAAGARRLEFDTTIDWGNEQDVLLKVAFPVAVRSDKARYEIQFGSVERPTHWNTPQDFAKFEVCAQRWADLSEADYGVASLNDCKYGYDIRDNVMRLSLLRAPKHPGKTADVNKQHRFCYALYPHKGPFTNGVVREGYELNAPLSAQSVKASRGAIAPEAGYFGITGENVVIESVKKAEDSSAIIVRMYEAHGSRGRRTFSTSLPVKRVREANLLEVPGTSLTVKKGKVALSFAPYQIRTLMLEST